jgi:hypothetical protein
MDTTKMKSLQIIGIHRMFLNVATFSITDNPLLTFVPIKISKPFLEQSWKLEVLNYRIDYNLISQTVEKVVKKYFLGRRNNSTSSGRQSSAIIGSTST